MTAAAQLAPYEVEACNTAKDSENKIHDDAVAKKFGFSGGLVPGVDIYGYMAHQPVARWGRAWLEHGMATCKLMKPVYDGDMATVTATETADGLAIEVSSKGVLCATGTAALGSAGAPVAASAYEVAPAPAHQDRRPPASETALPVGKWLNSLPIAVTSDFSREYLRDLRETDPLYAREGVMHPGMILRMGNRVLGHNVVLGPWIHVGSVIRNLGIGRVGETLTARARVAANDVRKGHAFVELDVLVLADERPVAHVLHTAIWRPRQLAAA